MDPRLVDLAEGGADDDEVALVLKLRNGAVPPEVRVVARFGDIVTCRLRRGAVLPLRESEAAVSVKAATGYHPDVEPAHIGEDDPPTNDPNERPPVPNGVTGRDVVVAVIDWGVDFTHADFRLPNGQTRLLAMWDQRLGRGGHAPSPYGYGRLHTREAINLALLSPEPFRAANYDPSVDDTGDGTHGTHTLGIAAGNGRGGGPRGIAPDADLLFVHLAPMRGENELHLADSVTLLEALDFVAHTAGSRPWVVNMSLGAHAGPHNGRTMVEQALDHLVAEAAGRAVVQSAGNYYNKRIHATGMLGPGQAGVFHVDVDGAVKTEREIDVWYSGRDRITVQLVAPDGHGSACVAPGERKMMSVGDRVVARIAHRDREPNGHDNNANLVILPDAPAGTWEVRLVGEDVVNGRYDAWVERNDGPHRQARLAEGDARGTGTTGTICNGFRTIAVGAIDGRAAELTVAPFSSSGPTRRDDRRKPDIVAPGVRVLSARSARAGATDGYVRKSGTSMASPCVAGAVALMFDAAPRALGIHETRKLLLATATPVPDGPERERVGNGVVDIVRAVEAARSVAAHAPPMAPEQIAARIEAAGRTEIETVPTQIIDTIAPARAEQVAEDDPQGFTPSEWRAIRITTTFENGRALSFGGLTGDFDGQGLSFGLLQWNVGTGSLQPLLRRFARDATAVARVFGVEADALSTFLRASHDDQMTFARSINDDRHHIREPWAGHFAQLADDPAFRRIQLDVVRERIDGAEQRARELGLTTERGLALMMDNATQSGPSWPDVHDRRSLIAQRQRALQQQVGRPLTELETMTIIADVVADTSLQRWREDVRRRRMTIVNGRGTVHGTTYDMQRTFGLTDRAWDASPSARVAAPPADAEGYDAAFDASDGNGAEAVPSGGHGTFLHGPLGGRAGDNVEARWNVDSATASGSTIDVVVHLHGFGEDGAGFLAGKASMAGVDLVDSSGAVVVRASRPTLVLVPRGEHTNGNHWVFQRSLPDAAAFDALVQAGLAWLASSVLRLPSSATLTRGRLTLMAHSGGGAGVSHLLDHGLDPDEVVCFDSMYGGEGPIRAWALRRLASAGAGASGLRVFYTGCSGPDPAHPAGQWVQDKHMRWVYQSPGSWTYGSDGVWHLPTTEVSSRRIKAALDRALAALPNGSSLTSRYRVERTSVAHSDIPARYTPALLDDVAANLPRASAAPGATVRPACVANDDWLTSAPQKPGGTDPPPPKPTTPTEAVLEVCASCGGVTHEADADAAQEHECGEGAEPARVTPALPRGRGLFEQVWGSLPDLALESSFVMVGRPGRRLESSLQPGDVIVRQLHAGEALASVVSDATLLSAQEVVGKLAMEAPRSARSRYVTVLDNGGETARARVALVDGDVVPFDQVIMRPRGGAPTDSPEDAERALAAYPPSRMSWPDAEPGALDFMRTVYEAHVRRSAARRAFVDDVPASQLRAIAAPGGGYTPEQTATLQALAPGYSLHVEVVDDARRMLLAAHAAWTAQRAQSDGPASGVRAIGVGSAYRSATWQFDHWPRNFRDYYERTRTQRDAMPGGAHGPQAVTFMVGFVSPKFGAPGFSNHNSGRAIDVTTSDTFDGRVVALGARTTEESRAAWRRSWLWHWLTAHASEYSFAPLASEEWHWDHPGASGGSRRESVAEAIYAPPGVRAFAPTSDAAIFTTAPNPVAETIATQWPETTTDPDAASEGALRASGVNDAGIRAFQGDGFAAMRPIAQLFGQPALIELLQRLRYPTAWLVAPPHSYDDFSALRRALGVTLARPTLLAMRLLLAVPGHFRELARRAGSEVEAYALENLGWLVMASLRGDVASATRVDFWVPPAPAFVTPFANPLPNLSLQTTRFITGRLLIDTTLSVGDFNARFSAWRGGLPWRAWSLETGRTSSSARAAGAPFYAELFTIPPSINIAAERAQVLAVWQQRLADFAAGSTATPLTTCDDTYLAPLNLMGSISLRGLEISRKFPSLARTAPARQLNGLRKLKPAFEAVFQAIADLGWNDLVFETQGMGCFRGTKIPGAGAAAAAKHMSEHSLGIAVDINVLENAQNTTGAVDPRIVALFEAFRFRWGKGFNTPDPMHFEYAG